MQIVMKNKKLVIIGAGETANLAYEYFTNDSEYEVIAFSVNQEYIVESSFRNLPVVPFENLESTFSPKEYFAFVAVAGEKLNRNREKLYNQAKNKGFCLASYISSKAFVWPNVTIGDNCFILEDNTLQPFSKVGNDVFMWSGNHLGHQSVIKDHCFITSHCVIAGFTEIGENCYLGINSSVADNIIVARDCYIGMGSLIGRNTKPGSFYSGVHSKKLLISSYEFLGVDDNAVE